MHSDPRFSARRPVKDRLGANLAPLQRQSQFIAQVNSALQGEKNPAVKVDVPKDATSVKLERDAMKTSKSTITGAVVQKVAPMNNHAKEPPAPSSGEKKQVVAKQLTVVTFLQKLGLSKFLLTFQAEEIDMFALKYMDDDDLKSIGLPMGPRKKILYGISRLKAKK